MNTIAVDRGNGQISTLSQVVGGRFLLKSGSLKTLELCTGFKEVRVRCFKPSHPRVLHFVLKGDSMMKYLLQVGTNTGKFELRFLGDDTSQMQQDYEKLKMGLDDSTGWIYNHLLWIDSVNHVQILKDRFECDDFHDASDYKHPGTWEYYVR